VSAPPRRIGILAYGSLLHAPGPELEALIVARSARRTPFGVEYGRRSRRWNGGPVLVPHPDGGPVDGAVLILAPGVTLGEAADALARREGCRPGGIVEAPLGDPGLIALSASLPRNLTPSAMTPDALADAALASVGEHPRNGIAYLRGALRAGIVTPRTREYARAVLARAGARTLEEAERLVASRHTIRRETQMAWDDVTRWQPGDLVAAFRMGDPVLPVDVRDLNYRESDEQVKGAVRIDPMEFEGQVPSLPEGKELIFYCDRPGEATSYKVALWAFDNGRSRVGVIAGGWSGWTEGGHPVEPKAG
jgi:rhodanese-related sulfurtransferase